MSMVTTSQKLPTHSVRPVIVANGGRSSWSTTNVAAKKPSVTSASTAGPRTEESTCEA